MPSFLSQLRALRPAAVPAAAARAPRVSLLIPALNEAEVLESTVREAVDYLSRRFPGDFEVLLIPTILVASRDRTPLVARALSRRYERVRYCPHFGPAGKGAALRSGFERARGRWIFFVDADHPYELGFFDSAARALEGGSGLVVGSRQHPDAPKARPSLRARLGRAFNAAARLLLPISTRDTQAGIKAMPRELAAHALAKAGCPGFVFDVELFLSARALAMPITELPVAPRAHVGAARSTVRLARESLIACYWLARIAVRERMGHYRALGSLGEGSDGAAPA